MPRVLLLVLPVLSLACRFDPAGVAAFDVTAGDVALPDLPAPQPDGALDAVADAAADAFAADAVTADAAAPDLPAPDSGVDPLAPFGTPTPVTELNSTVGEDDPTLTADMLEIYFNRGSDIWRSSRASVNDPWDPPTKATGLSSSDSETNPEMTPDGLTIYFASNRSDARSQGGYDIFVSTRTQRGKAWSAPVPVGSLNTSAGDHPAPAPDLLTMVVISDRQGGQGQHDLYLATRASVSAAWGPAAPIASLNTATQESSAWLDASTLLMYFASSRQNADHDIWLSTRSAPGQPFAAPVNISSLNSTATDEDPWLSPDLRTVYFSSTRNGNNDLFMATR